jgi:hypothetical protein
MRQRITTLSLIFLLTLSTVALAMGGDPQTLFTDNITATGTTTAVTDMEQQPLDRLNAATTSIDAAIYGLDRTSIVNALVAAHNRGATMRVVAYDEAYIVSAVLPVVSVESEVSEFMAKRTRICLQN